MTNLDKLARAEGLEITPNNTLPNGQRKVSDISRLINVARKVEQSFLEDQARHQDELIAETKARNEAERRCSELTAKLADATDRIQKLELAIKLRDGDFTHAQRQSLSSTEPLLIA
jgi:septal ring factor EnvC (AmiA/AmiB activator)